MAISYERLIQLIHKQIDDVYGNPSVAAKAVGDYYAEKGEPIGNCSPTMYRTYNWTPNGRQPKRSTLLKYAEAMNISLREESDENCGWRELSPGEGAAPEDRRTRTKKVVLNCIDKFQTPESYDVIEMTAKGLIDVEKSAQKAQVRTGPWGNDAARWFVSSETGEQEHDQAIAAEKPVSYGEKETGNDAPGEDSLKQERERDKKEREEREEREDRNDHDIVSGNSDDGCPSDAGE